MKEIANREQIPSMYESGLSVPQIGERVGLTRGAVGSILKARGVRLRSSKEGLQTRFPKGRFGSSSPRWRGGRSTAHPNGVWAYAPNHPSASSGRVFEHRLIMEKKLGRYLKGNEVVHHINGDNLDNREENLQVMSRSEHRRIHTDSYKEMLRLRAILDEHKIPYER